ncbi:hypothetical protein B0J11DRAFT_502916 [Dendryphion nanum]|uniref:F-box domain-containing protein n=1 Tax=Dendryphion nanum TaxID=256645 RepID=A0A9P9IZ01_9PLEO|nr:hypothetical protein B0J11DRAFT_502916 [Dendryphion nanum]
MAPEPRFHLFQQLPNELKLEILSYLVPKPRHLLQTSVLPRALQPLCLTSKSINTQAIYLYFLNGFVIKFNHHTPEPRCLCKLPQKILSLLSTTHIRHLRLYLCIRNMELPHSQFNPLFRCGKERIMPDLLSLEVILDTEYFCSDHDCCAALESLKECRGRFAVEKPSVVAKKVKMVEIRFYSDLVEECDGGCFGKWSKMIEGMKGFWEVRNSGAGKKLFIEGESM